MRRGLSTLVAIIILVAIVAVGALSTAYFALNMMRTLYGSIQIMFDYLNLQRSADKCVLRMILRNTGTKPITALKIVIAGEVYNEQVGVLEPGKATQIILNLPAEKFNVGKFYTLSVEVEASDGSKAAFTTNVMCLWGDF